MIVASRRVMMVHVYSEVRAAKHGDAMLKGGLRTNSSNAGSRKLMNASGANKPPMMSNINNQNIIARAPC